MPDSKITALTNLTSADAINDMFPIVDVSDNSITASGTTKRISVNNLLSSSPTASGALTITGLVTAGSATITGALTVRTDKLVVTETGVGIGTATPTVTLDVVGAARFVAAATGPKLSIENAGGSTRFLSTDTGSFYYSAYDHNFTNTANTVDRLVIANSGNVTVSTGNLIIGTPGKGIDFSATANSSGTMTSELLADYEEGTFTPTIDGTTTAGAGTYSSQTGRYTKVGNLVTFQVFIDWTAHTGTGNMVIGNLPFANGVNFWACTAGYVNGIALTAGNILTAYIGANVSNINLVQYPTGGGSVTLVPLDTAGTIVLSGSYTV